MSSLTETSSHPSTTTININAPSNMIYDDNYLNYYNNFYIFKILLSYLGIKHEINQISEIDHLVLNKLQSYDQFPIKDTGDYFLAKSAVISRYISNNYNFSGKSLQESAIVDEIIEEILEIIEEIVLPNIKSKTINEKIKIIISTYFLCFEKTLSKSTYIAGGDDYTIADLYLYILYDYIKFFDGFAQDFYGKFPHLDALKQHFESNKEVSEFIKNNPISF
ncbi:hypothetical protein DICPUDRAFT_93287 [Dictyostelium purpureum]|uniref:GST C-terminal domain-containing protein n=1 Tax=Dictyostelium purpureum TaxID=5786 RepID=F1A553_DICPU|nr:uncharacterized protein DICPUDRAFT_93287 [Dictyostelium purpureum]EGC28673.1 hypothetical protein DICPUDRAFT_93287 [Dictyostelium purpureum]|eukprot:XP_003294797.1 hypothetical protein DICPUDRAFT_93287 [Dictyostelium purpureum]